MEWSSILVAAIGIVALMHSTFANVEADCTADGNECAELTGGYCDKDATDGPKCACAAINDGVTGAACTPKDCSGGVSVCTSADTNSVCVDDECACKATFELTGADNSDVCVAKVIGSSCTTDGGECSNIAGAICDSSGESPICGCPNTHTANADGSQCTAKQLGSSCTADGGECTGITNSVCDTSVDDPVCACPTTHTQNTACVAKACTENTDCATPDVNAVCSNAFCACNVTFEISNSKLCQKKVIGSSCTTDGGECANVAGAVCEGESPICGCPTTHTANADGSQCTAKSNAIGPAVSVILLFACSLSKFLCQF